MQSEQPKVSILMNCYNGEKYLNDAIESVLAQTYLNWEVIFWDNQSTDRSAEIFKSYVDPRLKYYYAPEHTLLYDARNYALEKALGEFIAFLDVDDWWLPKKLEFQVVLFQNPEVGFVYSNYVVKNQSKGTQWLAFKKKLPEGMVLDDLLSHYCVGLLTLVIRRKALLYSISPFDSRYHIIGDFDIVIRLAAKWNAGVIQKILAGYRSHGENESVKCRGQRLMEIETWYEEHANHPVIGSSKSFYVVAYKILYQKAVNCLLSGNKLGVAKLIIQMPWGVMKFRLIGSLILPMSILKKLQA
jgi:glycosyltransferase involved in cell wall biosynthesis